MSIAVIPARGGSKRIPRKNIRDFCGRPMIAWSIRTARSSGCFDHVVVSTDDAEIAEVARAEGADVPFLRPASLAGDLTATAPVIQHAINELGDSARDADFVCCIYATAPFLEAEDLSRGRAALGKSTALFSFSVTTYAFPIERALRLRDDGLVEMLEPSKAATRSQDLEERYHDAGQFYWGRPAAWMSGASILGSPSVPVILPRHRVQDIDTPEDWRQAELMFKTLLQQPSGANK
jgi:pseudaminic acid cytidylyltransferase